jgi:hypothetical protein
VARRPSPSPSVGSLPQTSIFFIFIFLKNYNLTPQTVSYFASSPTNCQSLDSSFPNYKKVSKMPILSKYTI